MEQAKEKAGEVAQTLGIGGEKLRLETEINDKYYDTSIDSSIAFETNAKNLSSVFFDRAQEDLTNYKKRIDENAERQREHADIMADLQRKVEEYRRRFTTMESRITERKIYTESYGIDLPDIKMKDELWSGKFRMIDDMSEEELSMQLSNERRRNEELFAQLEEERLNNNQLLNEIQRLRKHFEISIRDKERIFINRERNIAQHLSEEQRKIMDLWTELKRVRKQCTEYKEQTERDLENQKNEFIKTIHNVTDTMLKMQVSESQKRERPLLSDATGNLEISKDSIIYEAISKFQETGDISEMPRIIRELHLGKGDDVNLQSEILKKYEESVQRIGELEAKDEDSHSKLLILESELKATKERLNDSQNALRRLYDLAREFEHSPDSQKRTRSFSPAKGYVPSSEVVRTVRYVLNARVNDSLVLQRKLNNAEAQINELITHYKSADESCRRLEKQLVEAKREISDRCDQIAELNRKLRNADDFIKTFEDEKANAAAIRRKLEDEIRRLNEHFKKTLAEIEAKAAEEAEERLRTMEDDYKARIAELTRRIDTLMQEHKHLKDEANELSIRNRNMDVEYKTLLQKIDDKDKEIRKLEDSKSMLLKEFDSQRARLDAVTNEIGSLRSNYENANKSSEAHIITLNELKQQRDDIGKQKDNVARELSDLKRNVDDVSKERDDARKAYQRQLADVDRLKAHISDLENQVIDISRQNDELDTQLKANKAKVTSLETYLQAANKEKEKSNAINQKLIKEKSEIMITIQKNETDTSSLKDQAKKLEQEIEKLRNEILLADEREKNANEAYKQQLMLARNLQNELNELRAELEDLQKIKLQSPEVTEVKPLSVEPEKPGDKISIHHDTTIYDITHTHVKEVENKWKIIVERLENEKDDLARQIQGLQEEITVRQDALDRQDKEIEDLHKKLDEQFDKVKLEMVTIQDKYKTDFDTDRDKYNQTIESMNIQIDELRNKLNVAETQLNDTKNRDAQLDRDINDWKERYNKTNEELGRIRDQLNGVQDNADKEIQRLQNDLYSTRNTLKTMESDNDSLKTQLTSSEENCKSLNKTIADQATKLRDSNSQMRHLTEEIDDLKKLRDNYEAELDNATSRLRSLETEYGQIQLDRNNTRGQLEIALKDNDLLKNSISVHEVEIDRLTKKLQQASAELSDRIKDLDQFKFERERVQIALREKAKLVENLNNELQNMDAKINRLRIDFSDTSDKLAVSDAERDSLRVELDRLHQQLQFSKEQLARKTNEYQTVIDELANAHRLSEDGRVNAVHDLEYSKLELGDLQSRLDKADQLLVSMQQNYLRSENERERLADALRRFQSIVNRSIMIRKFQEVIDSDKEKSDAAKEIVQPVKSAEGKEEQFDIAGLDTNFQALINRIEKLELERNDYREALERMKRRTGDVKLSKRETIIRKIDTREEDAGDKKAFDLRLESAKQLLRSQEEILKQREEEKRDLKSKLVSLEMQIRTKEGQIRHLNDLVKSLRSDLNNANGELRILRDREEQWDACKFHLESKLKDHEAESKKITTLTASFDADRLTLNEKVNKLTMELRQSENKYAELESDADRLRKDLERSTKVENELRVKVDQLNRVTNDHQILRDQLLNAENELSNLNGRKQQLENELLLARSEVRESKQRNNDAVHRISELQRQLEDMLNDKKRLNDRIQGLEKTVASYRTTETDLRQQISAAANERSSLQNELSDFQRRLLRLENDKRILSDKNEDLEKIRVTLMQRLALLESDKRAIEAMMTDMALQREAIEQSLNSLERENKELHRNCAQLQQQIAQLELENGNRLMSLADKQKEEQDRIVKTVALEKAQMERLIENRERGLKSRIKQLEAQLSALRDQLFSERRRRRDFSDRVYISDLSKTTSVLPAGSIYSGLTFPLNDTFDSYSSFGSYGSPWVDFSTNNEYTKTGSTVITLKESTTRRSRSPGGTGSPFAHDEGMHSYEITRKEESDGKSTHISEEAIVLQPSQELHESEYYAAQK